MATNCCKTQSYYYICQIEHRFEVISIQVFYILLTACFIILHERSTQCIYWGSANFILGKVHIYWIPKQCIISLNQYIVKQTLFCYFFFLILVCIFFLCSHDPLIIIDYRSNPGGSLDFPQIHTDIDIQQKWKSRHEYDVNNIY